MSHITEAGLGMVERIIVHEVMEFNNCAGKKLIDVTDRKQSELVPSRFRLTSAYMFPHEKLMLSTVGPTDEVVIKLNPYTPNVLILGEYVGNLSDIGSRSPICRCGTLTVSDGFDIYCPNDDCGLTLLSRIERLAGVNFFPPESFITENDKLEFLQIHDLPYIQTPFAPLLYPKFWIEKRGMTLDYILIKERPCHVSMATFLIEPLFQEFIDNVCPRPAQGYNFLTAAGAVFRHLEEITNRRNYTSVVQNTIIENFIYALGIEALQPDVIRRMVNYEIKLGLTHEVFLSYMYLLTHPRELMTELGVNRFEANAIYTEVFRRKFELFDIFAHYTSTDTAIDAFRSMTT